jgi:hypothetical protein
MPFETALVRFVPVFQQPDVIRPRVDPNLDKPALATNIPGPRGDEKVKSWCTLCISASSSSSMGIYFKKYPRTPAIMK